MSEGLKRFLNEKEVSIITGFSLSTLRNARASNTGMDYHKFSRSVRYDYDDVLGYMEDNKIHV